MALTRDTKIGFIGLGNLGRPMALSLMREGWRVTVSDRAASAQEACVENGALPAHTLQDFADCGLIALAVPDDAAVESILMGPDGLLPLLAPDTVILIHSTILPTSAIRFAEASRTFGVELLDAPVSGGAQRALDGTLTMMIGGTEEGVNRARPVLDSESSQALHVGPSGAGSAVKLSNQLMMFSTLAGAYEAMALAAAHGVAEKDVLACVTTSTGDSWIVRNWSFFDDTASAYNESGTPVADRPWAKDLWEVVAAARAAGVQVPVAGLLSQHLAERVEHHADDGSRIR